MISNISSSPSRDIQRSKQNTQVEKYSATPVVTMECDECSFSTSAQKETPKTTFLGKIRNKMGAFFNGVTSESYALGGGAVHKSVIRKINKAAENLKAEVIDSSKKTGAEIDDEKLAEIDAKKNAAIEKLNELAKNSKKGVVIRFDGSDFMQTIGGKDDKDVLFGHIFVTYKDIFADVPMKSEMDFLSGEAELEDSEKAFIPSLYKGEDKFFKFCEYVDNLDSTDAGLRKLSEMIIESSLDQTVPRPTIIERAEIKSAAAYLDVDPYTGLAVTKKVDHATNKYNDEKMIKARLEKYNN